MQVRPDQREVRYWMKHFNQATDPTKLFAIIQLSEDVFRVEEDEQVTFLLDYFMTCLY